MPILVEAGILVASLAALVLFADKLVDSSVRLARAFGIGASVIGLTLVAYGTSLPEFAVSAISSVSGHSDLSISNVVGSNIFNVAVILGLVALMAKVRVREAHFIGRDVGFMLFSTILLVGLAYVGGISRVAGFLMAVLLAGYTYSVIRAERSKNNSRDGSVSKLREAGLLVFGLAGVLFSGKYVVSSAVNVALILGVSEWLIGATIVAAGTSLPELAVSIISARKGEFGLSIGNIVSSNIFNILWILGFAAILSPLAFSPAWVDLLVLVITTAFLSYCLFRKRITRIEGFLYLLIYGAYLSYLLK